MKNNKMMRAAALMMSLTLMTSCFVGGTFAKYVTSADSTDNARVAKFGVELKVAGGNGDFFKTTYQTDETGTGAFTGAAVTAVTNADGTQDKIVAPGTKSGNDSLKFSVKGTPEVAVRVEVKFEDPDGEGDKKAYQEIFLKDTAAAAESGTAGQGDSEDNDGYYRDWTKAVTKDGKSDYSGTFKLDSYKIKADATENTTKNTDTYYPVIFTLKQTKDENGEIKSEDGQPAPKELVRGTLEDINDFLSNTTNGYSGTAYQPNTVLDTEFEISWEWPFEVKNSGDMYDKADTLLGNLAADANTYKTSKWDSSEKEGAGDWTDLEEGTDYSTELYYNLVLSVTQID